MLYWGFGIGIITIPQFATAQWIRLRLQSCDP